MEIMNSKIVKNKKMKNRFVTIAILLTSLLTSFVFAQSKDEPVSLGLPGDDLDLYAVMEVFQKSKTIEDFEKELNSDKSKINNLDLDKDKKVDFIKVITNKDGDAFDFILQVAVSKTENQDVAVILVSKDKSGKVAMQIVGDEDLYGKNYVVEPKGSGSAATTNPGYTGGSTETMNIPAQTAPTTTVVVQSAPIVQYVYSPAYVPYYPPYYYGFYPPYFHPFVPITRAIYWSNHFYCHGGYYGGYHGSVNININHVNHYNNYNNNSRNRSTTVANNRANGSYGNRVSTGNNSNRANNASTRPSTRDNASTRPSTRDNALTRDNASTRPSSRDNAATRPSTRPTSPSNAASTRQSSGASNYARPSSSNNSFNSGSSNRASNRASNYSGGGRSGGYSGGGRSSGGFSGGGRGGRR